MLTAIIPDPDRLSGYARHEVYGDSVQELVENARNWLLLETGYASSDVGARFKVYSDGAVVGTLTYGGSYHEMLT